MSWISSPDLKKRLAAAGTALFLLGAAFTYGVYVGDQDGYTRGKRYADSETHRQVHAAHSECHDLLENQRAWYEGLHDRAAVTWKNNMEGLMADMEHYEEDLERCRHVSTR